MLKEKNILITGGNSGIGFFATINLLKTKNNLYIPIRSSSRRDNFFVKLLKYFDKKYLEKYLNLIENVDLANLEIGASIKISSVKLPENAKPTITDRDFVVATIAAPTIVKEPEKPAEETPAEGADGEAAPAADGQESAAPTKEGDAAKKDEKGKEGGAADKKQSGDKKATPEKKPQEKK